VNLNPIPSLMNLVPVATKLKDIIGTTSPPKLDNGAEMCLSFLLRQGCWSNCRRAAQHTATLSTNEQQRLTSYLNQRTTPMSTPSGSASRTSAAGTQPP
jgi:hypothetical protein